MIKKIRSSLWLKIFLLLTVLLFAVSFLLYGIVMAVMPTSYKYTLTDGYIEKIGQLVTDSEGSTLERATQMIYEFCVNNSASARLENGNTQLSFGSDSPAEPPINSAAQTTTTSLELADGTYSLQIFMPAKLANQLTEAFWRLLPVIGGVILFIALLASYFMTRFLTKPVLEISGISKRLAALDMTWRCSTKRTDEVGILANNLNTMAEQLDTALRDLTAANAKLQEDIEQERRQEKMRVDFFRAVSHELKTPITVLKGELEGMIYQVGEYKDRDKHLRSSMRTVREMEDLVKEILSVSRMAGSDFTLNEAKIDMAALVRACCRKWQGLAEDRGQQLSVDISDCTYVGDRDLLEKAVSNIIGNAVAHSETGSEVSVSLKEKVLEVTNAGHIPDDELGRIFEPFYRREDSHNRRTGGSGLGLHIVKTILERHGLPYCMENFDDGVRFTVRLE